jgi:chromosome segregation ATPase
MVLEVNDNASSLADSNTDSPGNVTQCVKESGYGDIDQQLSADDRIALLKREVKAVVGMNNELLAEMETMESKHAQAFDQERKRVNSLQCEMRQLSLSNEQFADRNNHLTEKIKEMSEEMRELDLQCQEKDRLCLKTQCDLETLSNYKKLTESLTRDNTDLLCELDKIQVFVQNGKINDDSSSKEKKVLLDQLRNYDDRHKKLTAQMHDVESANSDLLRKNEKLEAELASIVVNMQVCELESKHLRSRVHCEVLEEVCQESVKNCALDAENSEYKGVVLQLNEEISDLKCERSRLLKETREQSILIEQLTSEENAERLQSLSKELRDMLVERDQYKARLSEKHDCLLATESKLIDEQKKTFILSSTLKELQDEVDRKKSMVDSTKNELTYQIDSLTRQSAKLTTERDELATLCAAQTAKLREVDEEAKKEYAIRRQERKSSNKTLLELEDACNRELILTRKYEMAHDEFTRERENLINKIDKQTSISTMLHTKVSDLEEQLHDSKTEILSLQRTKKSLMDETIILQGDIESLKASFATKVKESSDKIKALEQDIDIYKTKLQDTQYQMKESRSKYKANTIELNTSLQGADERCKIISDEVNKLQLLVCNILGHHNLLLVRN